MVAKIVVMNTKQGAAVPRLAIALYELNVLFGSGTVKDFFAAHGQG